VGYQLHLVQSRSGQLDKRPALEHPIANDRQTGAYVPELAVKWQMAPDGKSWPITLRKGVKFHEHWGEFTAKHVRHSIFLITQPESVQTDVGLWRSLMGIGERECRSSTPIKSWFTRNSPRQS
jgi:ABC-type transport system substrate-binding protein